MIRVHAGECAPGTFTKSVFLAGPTPRDHNVVSWRPAAVEELAATGYDEVVFVPEPRHGTVVDYDEQIDWEHTALHMSDVALFWVPRDLETLPGFTTNVEWSRWENSGKVVFGSPPDAPKNAARHGVPVGRTLAATVRAAVEKIGGGAERWRSPKRKKRGYGPTPARSAG